MKVVSTIALIVLIMGTEISPAPAGDFGLAENSIGEFRAIRYENVYTKVPTSGKLAAIRITDSGKVFYICREKTGYVIYNLEIRPIEGFKDKIDQEIKDNSKQWDRVHPDELLFTKERHDYDLKRRLKKYSEAVWVRNEIVIEEAIKDPNRKD
ncbi:MAG: hypothetical protein WCG29_07765 [Desulfomonile sp.]|nr:hypothetical protein [Deltaproteobacteria bacterium]